LERDRSSGRGIPFRKFGRHIRYGRDDVMTFVNAASFTSTREAKART
jgi:hypothetical protein